MDHASDAEVMTAAREDPAVFGVIFDRHAPALLRYLVRRLGSEAGEPLLGEVFRTAFERRAAFDPAHASAGPWLYGIAQNLLLKHRRSEARRLRALGRLAVENPGRAADENSVIEGVDLGTLLPRVADAITALPDPEREALLLYAWEEQSYEAIATAQGVPVGTVRSRLHRAREKLRELRESFGEEGDKTPAGPGRDRR